MEGVTPASLPRRVVVDDAPPFGPLPQEQREPALRGPALTKGKPPAASRERHRRSQQLDVQVLEAELSHLLAFGLVALPVALHRRLPAARGGGVGLEDQVRRLPVSMKASRSPRFQAASCASRTARTGATSEAYAAA